MDEKDKTGDREVLDVKEDKRYSEISLEDIWTAPQEWHRRLVAEYTGQHDGKSETLPAGSDPERVARAILTLNEEESLKELRSLVENCSNDYTIDYVLIERCKQLLEGSAACELSPEDWSYVLCKTAGTVLNWSSYAEVRAVTLPYDDPEEPFFSPRQPGISIPGQVIQLLIVPMGRFLAMSLPDWGFRLRGTRYTLNPGPWSSKEQLLATIISQANTTGNFTGLLVMRLPVFFEQRWAGFGFAIVLALANQIFGLGAAGMLRRLSVYPQEAVWPSVLPTLALNRALIHPDNKGEIIHGWKISRYRSFVIASAVFLVYYWIPNRFFQALRLFNWMTWISPNNKNLAIVTGSYGGMGFNPFSSWDPNASGSTAMNAPFFAQLQQYCMRVIAGLVILIMYYTNMAWAAYMPINSNAAFDKNMGSYNITKVLTPDNRVDIDAYKVYGPPYYAVANLFITGANFIYYTFSIVYVFVKYWKPLKKAFAGIVVNTIKRRSIYTGFTDGHTRLMKPYKEVPEWWYTIVFVFGFVISVVGVAAWPTQTPWWSILIVVGVGTLLTIPWIIIESIAATGISFNVIWQVLPGIIWPGQPLPQLIILMLGGAFEQMAGGFAGDLKYAHYAKLPPRAVFRGHIASCVVNCFIYCGMLEVMVAYFNTDNTLCQWNNKQYMVCQYANSVYSSVISFGAFGTNNMFELYPILPWCFLIGAVLGLIWVLTEKAAPRIRQAIQSRMDAKQALSFDKYMWNPTTAVMATLNPAVALSGALQWAGNTNLSYATLGIFIAWYFQYYLKRRYTAWWGKYAYMVFAGLSVGVAISGLIVTLVFSFGVGKNADLGWWGNNIALRGVDYQLYNNNASLLAAPEGGFGLAPEDYPLRW
ncbi:related to Oligopeptide transporter 2 [Rhynchosporium secalis]|uniref:Related to Oligopeptide transporter 2 n=1 Tax=Rhynchosporium secalis TaxID=38038 RepID=A0A1E1MW67_RHYSE|nr:related to Oligopeptide transporter 2 [Rhynchosporium secalis]